MQAEAEAGWGMEHIYGTAEKSAVQFTEVGTWIMDHPSTNYHIPTRLYWTSLMVYSNLFEGNK